ncbi:MAG: PfkB family carbohydrate kinase [Candidatus Omnitrophota bacterium]
MGIVVVGSVALDNVITPYGKNFNAPGGSASYFSLSASYFTKVKLVAVVGDDFPTKYIRFFNKKGIDTSGLEIKKGKTFRWKGRYDLSFDNPQTLETHLNLFKDFRPALPPDYRDERIVFLANIDPDLQLEVLKQTKPTLSAADTISLWIEHKRKSLLEVLGRIDVFIINEHEARQLTKEPNLLKAGKRIISYGVDKVIIKKGENGLLYFTKKSFVICPAYLLENIKDPTGAGDTFAGGFLGYLASRKKRDEKAFKRALIYGSVMASFVVEHYDIKAHNRLNRRMIEQRALAFKHICSL